MGGPATTLSCPAPRRRRRGAVVRVSVRGLLLRGRRRGARLAAGRARRWRRGGGVVEGVAVRVAVRRRAASLVVVGVPVRRLPLRRPLLPWRRRLLLLSLRLLLLPLSLLELTSPRLFRLRSARRRRRRRHVRAGSVGRDSTAAAAAAATATAPAATTATRLVGERLDSTRDVAAAGSERPPRRHRVEPHLHQLAHL